MKQSESGLKVGDNIAELFYCFESKDHSFDGKFYVVEELEELSDFGDLVGAYCSSFLVLVVEGTNACLKEDFVSFF